MGLHSTGGAGRRVKKGGGEVPTAPPFTLLADRFAWLSASRPAGRCTPLFDTSSRLLRKRSLVLGGLALRELEAAACLGAAVLLALDDARVAGEEAGLLHDR